MVSPVRRSRILSLIPSGMHLGAISTPWHGSLCRGVGLCGELEDYTPSGPPELARQPRSRRLPIAHDRLS